MTTYPKVLANGERMSLSYKCTPNLSARGILLKLNEKQRDGKVWSESPHTVRTLSMIYCHLSLTIEVTRKEIWAPDCISMCELILKDSDMNLDINTEVFQHNSKYCNNLQGTQHSKSTRDIFKLPYYCHVLYNLLLNCTLHGLKQADLI